MKCAIISPIPLLNTYATLGHNYHLILGHILRDSPEYKRFYQERAAKGDFIILDNSAHEFGVGSDITELIKLSYEVGASEIVLPDRLFFGDDTLYYAQQAFPKVKKQLPYTSIMGVPQGRTITEYIKCLDGLITLGVDTIGISKDYEVWTGGLERLVKCIGFSTGIKIHLLGWGRNMIELHSLGRLYGNIIRGVDSAKPLQYAASNIMLPDTIDQPIPEYPRRALNFFGLPNLPRLIAVHNINCFKSWAQGVSYIK